MYCRHANGARDVFKHGATQSMEKVEVSYYMPMHKTTYYTTQILESHDPYITSFQLQESSDMPYITRLSSNYLTNYGDKESRKEVKAPYIMSYEAKEGTKEVQTPYVMGYETKQSLCNGLWNQRRHERS